MKELFSVLVAICISTLAFSQNDPTPAAKGVTYGEAPTNKDVVTVDKMEQQVSTDGNFNGKVTVKVTEVCQEKGCWMRVEKQSGETMLVRFKDYGFFMPKNIVGQTVVLEGEAKVKEVSVKQQQHYAEDAGKSKEEIEKIKTPKKETQFIAKGVLVL